MKINCDTGVTPKDLTIRERRTERLEGDEWKLIPFSEIKKGDIFRLFDDSDDPIEVGKPYKAVSNAFSGPNGIYIVYIEA